MHINLIRATLFGGGASLALLSGAAHAQPSPTARDTPTAAEVAVAEAEPAAAEPAVTADIVVTARRRVERAQDVPIALNVVDDKALAATGDFTLTQVQQLVPSLQVFGGNARNTNINIRGLGSNSINNDGLENGVGFWRDQHHHQSAELHAGILG